MTVFGESIDSSVRSVSFGAGVVFVRKMYPEDSGFPQKLVFDKSSRSESLLAQWRDKNAFRFEIN